MISTEGLKEGDIVFIWAGSDEQEESEPLVKLEAKYTNGIFVTTRTKKFNSGETSWEGEIYGSSVVRFKKKEKRYAMQIKSRKDYGFGAAVDSRMNPEEIIKKFALSGTAEYERKLKELYRIREEDKKKKEEKERWKK